MSCSTMAPAGSVRAHRVFNAWLRWIWDADLHLCTGAHLQRAQLKGVGTMGGGAATSSHKPAPLVCVLQAGFGD